VLQTRLPPQFCKLVLTERESSAADFELKESSSDLLLIKSTGSPQHSIYIFNN